MTHPPHRVLRQTLGVWLIAALALVACSLPQAQPLASPAATAPQTSTNVSTNANDSTSAWPEPAPPLDSTPIGPVESAGASAAV